MTKHHDKPSKPSKPRGRVAEPVQVYLAQPDRARLDWLVDQLQSTKSDVLRRALEALERQVGDPADHPALRVIGLAGRETGPAVPYDVAREHDRFVADLEDARIAPAKRRRRGA